MRKSALAFTPALALSMACLGTTSALAASTGAIEVTYNCETGSWDITSEKALSNIVVSDGTSEEKTEFDDSMGETHMYSVADPDGLLGTIWVKAGNNASGDGPGYGERFTLEAPDCDPDADGDGYPASEDCDDSDATINPGAVDIPNDGIDQNCDGSDLVVGDGELRFTLLWDSADDLDLHIVEPSGERLWFGDTASATGGLLDRDDNVGTCAGDPEPGGVENVYWPVGAAPTGTYTIEIDNFSDCNDANTGSWTLQVHQDGVLIATYTGTEGDNVGAAYSGEFKVFGGTHDQP
ncbi:MopE-related protein [Ornithinimicrobium tianjinense]|uniref:P/Homo B domain-containing protein n=1 Tax=Ornithinimicrobium tianjinense TaxID=1195761 RepID=A0A917F4A3_9MICO|nr:MopE-related protein [Ornithinimicrobium tianjinense]GGF44804.1 hypothetical protein GCM10011366_10640 [Ornithinimicrobium tianjinense]